MPWVRQGYTLTFIHLDSHFWEGGLECVHLRDLLEGVNWDLKVLTLGLEGVCELELECVE